MAMFRFLIIIWILLPDVKGINCPTPPEIENGFISPIMRTKETEDGKLDFTPGMSIPPLTKVIYKCNTRCYSMVGKNKIFCFINGTYNRDPPQCVEAPLKCRPAWIKRRIINATQEYANHVNELNAKWWNESAMTMEERQTEILLCLFNKMAARDAMTPLIRKKNILFESEKIELEGFMKEFVRIGKLFTKLKRSWLAMDIDEPIET